MSSTKTRKVLFKVKTLVDAAQDTHVADSSSSTTNWNNEANSLIYNKLNAALTTLTSTKNTEIGTVDGSTVTWGNIGTEVGTYFTGLRDNDDGTGSGTGFKSNIFNYLESSISSSVSTVSTHYTNNYNDIDSDIQARKNTKAGKTVVEALDEYAKVITSAIDFNDGAYVYETSRIQGLNFLSDQYAPDMSAYEAMLNSSSTLNTEVQVTTSHDVEFEKYFRVYLCGNSLLYTKVNDTTAPTGVRSVLIRQGGMSKDELTALSGGVFYRENLSSGITLTSSTVNVPSNNIVTYSNELFSYSVVANNPNSTIEVFYNTYYNIYWIRMTIANTSPEYFINTELQNSGPGKHYDEVMNPNSVGNIYKKMYDVDGWMWDSIPIKRKYAAELVLEKDAVYMSSTTNLFYVKQNKNIVGAGYVPLYTKFGMHFMSNVYGNTMPSMADLVRYDCFYYAGSDSELTGEEIADIGANPVLVV